MLRKKYIMNGNRVVLLQGNLKVYEVCISLFKRGCLISAPAPFMKMVVLARLHFSAEELLLSPKSASTSTYKV